jgi:hypothetical protein
MARQIKIRDIEKYHRESVELAVKATTLEWDKRCKEETPVDTGNLRNGWRSNIRPLLGEIVNPVEYAEPVCYGINLPPSWGGTWHTRTPNPTGNALGTRTRQGFPDLIGKELEPFTASILRRR